MYLICLRYIIFWIRISTRRISVLFRMLLHSRYHLLHKFLLWFMRLSQTIIIRNNKSRYVLIVVTLDIPLILATRYTTIRLISSINIRISQRRLLLQQSLQATRSQWSLNLLSRTPRSMETTSLIWSTV